MRDRYHSLLQILGCLAVIAFHGRVPFADGGWAAVVLFFVLGGHNMANALVATDSAGKLMAQRYKRLVVPLILFSPVVIAVAWAQQDRSNALGYLAASPFLAHNLLRPWFAHWEPGDSVWIPLWFVGTLFQLQCLALLCRRWISTRSIPVLIGTACALGFGSRLAIGAALGVHHGEISRHAADVVYWFPLTHIESLAFGILLARGTFKPGRHLWPILAVTLLLGGLQILWHRFGSRALGYNLGLVENFQFVWGYPVLGLLFAALVDKDNPLAKAIHRFRLPPGLDSVLNSLSRASFWAYITHGALLLALLTVMENARGVLAYSNASRLATAGAAAVLAFAIGLLATRRRAA